MRMFYSFAIICALLVCQPVEGAFTIYQGRTVDVSKLPYSTAEEHFALAINALNNRQWNDAIQNIDIISFRFPESPYAKDAAYYLGVGYQGRKDYRQANTHLTTYMQSVSQAKFFREAVELKLRIAEQLRATNSLFTDYNALALEIYDELVAVFPQDEICAKALFGKAMLQREMGDFQESITIFQELIKRFPKHELSPESYIAISQVYTDQSQRDKEKFDTLELAKLNLHHFQADFPQEERITEVMENCRQIAELYASSMWKIAAFYERIDKPVASVIYYRRIIHLFPETNFAEQSRQRLARLLPPVLDLSALS